ncbi:hypothetical protein SKAU_G00243600 [Synaphobranchus kaupii]|uniref:Uncharacterized protein n=1 Tax=Synaphobranchus kaupii TaxID=118154 RepID=A0A9Q1IUG8_SYNKA|nr:hypothetical protein SKAU_G00243600 [Synaphobranchus kaupii]
MQLKQRSSVPFWVENRCQARQLLAQAGALEPSRAGQSRTTEKRPDKTANCELRKTRPIILISNTSTTGETDRHKSSPRLCQIPYHPQGQAERRLHLFPPCPAG